MGTALVLVVPCLNTQLGPFYQNATAKRQEPSGKWALFQFLFLSTIFLREVISYSHTGFISIAIREVYIRRLFDLKFGSANQQRADDWMNLTSAA